MPCPVTATALPVQAPSSTHQPAGRLLAAGVVGSVLLAVSSWSVGGVPVGWRNELSGLPWTLYYLGLVLTCVAWLALGLRVRARTVGTGYIRRFALATAAPLLGAAPFGRDLWAYAAQGQVTGRGLDPYGVGPSAVPGAFAREVSARWVHSPAPYGPAWLRISQLATWLAGHCPAAAAMLLRLPSYLGLVLCCWAVTALARRFGARADLALWLGPACPLMIVLGVGGGHNDLLALGLALAGLALASRSGVRSLALGAAVTGAAVMVKSPALIALAFTVPVWLVADPGERTRRRILTACATAAASGGAVCAVVTAAAGLGSGWTRQVGAGAPWTSALSLPTALGMLGRALTGQAPVRQVEGLIHTSRTVGEVLAVLVIAGLWVWAVRRAMAGPGGNPMGLLAGALAAAVLLAPAVQPWYYLWAVLPAALIVRRRGSFVGLATVGLLFPIMIMPSGQGWESDLRFPVVVAVALLVVVLTYRRCGDLGRAGPGSPTT
jgi:alpha-1,6-mannosyltransferase